jgi:uncharacterized protein (DUF427 family)
MGRPQESCGHTPGPTVGPGLGRAHAQRTHDVLPYKGDASYYSIPAGGDRSLNAAWTYETPFEAMARIKDYVAFYPDRVDEIS